MNPIDIPVPPTHCTNCGAEYEHIGHPLHPGAIMMSVCKCRLVTIAKNGNSITFMVPPDVTDDQLRSMGIQVP